MAEENESTEYLARQLEELRDILLGNGQPGLLREVSMLRGQLNEMKEHFTKPPHEPASVAIIRAVGGELRRLPRDFWIFVSAVIALPLSGAVITVLVRWKPQEILEGLKLIFT